MTDVRLPDCVWPEWEFVKQIGRGSYGVVYEAVRRDEFQVESRAAIKVISIPQDSSELDTLRTEGLDEEASRLYMKRVVTSFVDEIKFLNQLKGVPNIVGVEDYKVTEKTDEIGWDISIRMELLTSLHVYIADKSLQEREVAKLGCDICSALEVCAKKNLIHRDIKPGNIFVNEFGDFKLGDFGIARQMEGMAVDYSRKGTGSYMAPEVERGEPYNASVDLYSLGLVLYFLLNNKRLPFLNPGKQLLTPAEREQAVRRRLNGETFPPPCNASPEMAGILLTACAFDPKRRFASATAMKNALLTVLQGDAVPQQQEVVPEPEEPKESPQPSKSQKGRTLLLCIGVICVCAAALLCILLLMQRARTERYQTLVEQQAQDRTNGDAADEEEAYVQATALRPGELESYYQHARMLYEQPAAEGMPDYNACIRFIEEDILENGHLDLTEERMADIYYLYADSLFQSGAYSAAVDAYRELFRIGTGEALYYRDYAIALAYDGLSARAESVLDEAEDLGFGSDDIYYTRGEVEKARGESVNALEDFVSCIRLTQDEELCARAYLACAEIYRDEDRYAEEREALLEAKKLESTRTPQILQYLIQADMDLADAAASDAASADSEAAQDAGAASVYRQEAIDTLNLVITNGWETFTTYNNLVILYQQEGDLGRAEEVLLSVADLYSENYRWYKRYAFLELDRQDALDNSDRDYTAFAGYYSAAQERYQAEIAGGGITDSEMSVLEQDYEEVSNGGWLSE